MGTNVGNNNGEVMGKGTDVDMAHRVRYWCYMVRGRGIDMP